MKTKKIIFLSVALSGFLFFLGCCNAQAQCAGAKDCTDCDVGTDVNTIAGKCLNGKCYEMTVDCTNGWDKCFIELDASSGNPLACDTSSSSSFPPPETSSDLHNGDSTCNVTCTGKGAYYSSKCGSNDWGWGACPNVPGKEMCCVPNSSSSADSAACSNCMQDCNNLNANAPEVPTDCESYCSSKCGSGASPGSNNDTPGDYSQSDIPGDISSKPKCDPKYFTPVGGVCFPINTGLSEASITDILRNFLMWILGIFGFLAILAFVISGIQYLLSAGDEKMIETAKRNLKWSLVGVVVALSGFIIILAVTAALQAFSPSF